jgi:hypothetical protein
MADQVPATAGRWSTVLTARIRRIAPIVVGLLLVPASVARGAGAPTISGAPVLALNQLVVGGGRPVEYYRLSLFAGDRIDLRYTMLDQPDCGYLYLFDPSVSDFDLRQAKAVSSTNVHQGQQAVTLTSPFNGLGTVAIAIDPPGYQSPSYPPLSTPGYGCTVVTPYSVNASVEHLTQARFSGLPSAVRSSHLRLLATVASPAGQPAGSCLFEAVAGSLPRKLGTASTHDGRCRLTIRRPTTSSRYRVTFSGPGWQTAQALSRRVRPARK